MIKGKVDHWMEEIRALREFQFNQTDDAKLQWLNQHLFEYIQRWAGFAIVEGIDVKATLANDLFFLIIAAINLVNGLVESGTVVKPFPHYEWERFTNSIEFIQSHPRKENVGLIGETFNEYLIANGDMDAGTHNA